MGREIRRVPLDFDWPIGQVWHGFLRPDEIMGKQCPACQGNGYSDEANALWEQWYGFTLRGIAKPLPPFEPSMTGSVPWSEHHPLVWEKALHNVVRERGSTRYEDVLREAIRLSEYFNRQWAHHLAQEDVQALFDAHRLFRMSGGSPVTCPTAAEVNVAYLSGLGHDSLNAHIVIKARLEREGLPLLCPHCDGECIVFDSDEQRAAHDEWQPTVPPEGDGWQVWETVTEGSPTSPVFATGEELVQWLVDMGYGETASRQFVFDAGWVPSLAMEVSGGQATFYNDIESAGMDVQ